MGTKTPSLRAPPLLLASVESSPAQHRPPVLMGTLPEAVPVPGPRHYGSAETPDLLVSMTPSVPTQAPGLGSGSPLSLFCTLPSSDRHPGLGCAEFLQSDACLLANSVPREGGFSPWTPAFQRPIQPEPNLPNRFHITHPNFTEGYRLLSSDLKTYTAGTLDTVTLAPKRTLSPMGTVLCPAAETH